MSVLVARDLVVVSGPDAEKYLQGQLSNDVTRLAAGDSVWAFLLEPNGKLGFLCRVRRVSDTEFAIDLEPGQAAALEARLRRFLIRTKVTLTTATMVVDLDGAGDGAALVGWWDDGRHTVADGDPSSDDAATAEQRRIEAGWPGPAELEDGLIPGETGVVSVAVSFEKGCYTGQELVARIDSRGNNVPFHLRKLQLTADASPTDDITADGSSIGRVTSVSGHIGLGYVARRIEVPAGALVAGSPVSIVDQRSA